MTTDTIQNNCFSCGTPISLESTGKINFCSEECRIYFKTVDRRGAKSSWSMEVASNLKYVHGIDIETELIQELSKEIRRSIDNQIMEDMNKWV